MFLPKRMFLEEPRCVRSQKMAFFIVTAVKTSNLTMTHGIEVGPVENMEDKLNVYVGVS
jgi:hypothetical protein